jgi:hypothetical protein
MAMTKRKQMKSMLLLALLLSPLALVACQPMPMVVIEEDGINDGIDDEVAGEMVFGAAKTSLTASWPQSGTSRAWAAQALPAGLKVTLQTVVSTNDKIPGFKRVRVKLENTSTETVTINNAELKHFVATSHGDKAIGLASINNLSILPGKTKYRSTKGVDTSYQSDYTDCVRFEWFYVADQMEFCEPSRYLSEIAKNFSGFGRKLVLAGGVQVDSWAFDVDGIVEDWRLADEWNKAKNVVPFAQSFEQWVPQQYQLANESQTERDRMNNWKLFTKRIRQYFGTAAVVQVTDSTVTITAMDNWGLLRLTVNISAANTSVASTGAANTSVANTN